MPTSTAVGCPEKVGKMTKTNQTKEGRMITYLKSQGAHPLLFLPYIAYYILCDVHKLPQLNNDLRKKACAIFLSRCDDFMAAIKPFKKSKNGFDFAKAYKKWLSELQRMFIVCLKAKCKAAWKIEAEQITDDNNPLYKHDYERWKVQALEFMQDRYVFSHIHKCFFDQLSCEQLELHKKATKVFGLSSEWTYTNCAGILTNDVLPPRKRRKTWQEVKVDAEAYVKKYGYSGFGRLQAKMSCSKGTLREATKHSKYLEETKAKYDAIPHKPRAVTQAEENIVRLSRPPKPMSDEEVNSVIDKLYKDVERKQGHRAAQKFREQINDNNRESMARYYNEILRKLFLENKKRKANSQPPLTMFDDWQDIPSHSKV